jgi:hypothetical protein
MTLYQPRDTSYFPGTSPDSRVAPFWQTAIDPPCATWLDEDGLPSGYTIQPSFTANSRAPFDGSPERIILSLVNGSSLIDGEDTVFIAVSEHLGNNTQKPSMFMRFPVGECLMPGTGPNFKATRLRHPSLCNRATTKSAHWSTIVRFVRQLADCSVI